MNAHTHTHTHTDSHTHARTHAHTHTHQTHSNWQTQTHTHTLTHTDTHTHTHAHTHARAHTHTHTHTLTHADARTHARRTHARTCTPVAYQGNQDNETDEKLFFKDNLAESVKHRKFIVFGKEMFLGYTRMLHRSLTWQTHGDWWSVTRTNNERDTVN